MRDIVRQDNGAFEKENRVNMSKLNQQKLEEDDEATLISNKNTRSGQKPE